MSELTRKRTILASGRDRYEISLGAVVILTTSHPPSEEEVKEALVRHRAREAKERAKESDNG